MASIAPLLKTSGGNGSRSDIVLKVDAQRAISYCIFNSPAPIFDVSNDLISEVMKDRRVFVVVDQRVMEHHGRGLLHYFTERTNLVHLFAMSGSEQAKNWSTLERICSEAMRLRLERTAVLAAVGGGVVLDVAGMAAALYRRGIRYVRIPTTLVGAVDVAVGIKHAFNFHGKKNVLGAFYPPMAAIVDRRLLHTASKRDLACGLAEIIKLGWVRDARLFALVEQHGLSLLESSFQYPSEAANAIIVRAQQCMIGELQDNLFEDDMQRLADFGHTFSPAIEAGTHYAVRHGEAVAIDMYLSALIGMSRGAFAPSDLSRVRALYNLVGLPTFEPTISSQALYAAVKEARCHRGGRLNLVVPTGIGTAMFLQDVTRKEIEGAMETASDSGQAAASDNRCRV